MSDNNRMNGWLLIAAGFFLVVIGIPLPGLAGYLLTGMGGFCMGWGIVQVKDGT